MPCRQTSARTVPSPLLGVQLHLTMGSKLVDKDIGMSSSIDHRGATYQKLRAKVKKCIRAIVISIAVVLLSHSGNSIDGLFNHTQSHHDLPT